MGSRRVNSSLSGPKGTDCIQLEAVAIYFESLALIWVEKFHCSIGINLMNGERTNPPGL